MTNPERVEALYFYLDESGGIEWPPGHTHICLTLLVIKQYENEIIKETKKGIGIRKRRTPKHKLEQLITRTIVGLRNHLFGKHKAEMVEKLGEVSKKEELWLPELKGWSRDNRLMGINYHLDDIGYQFYTHGAKIKGFCLATILFDKQRAFEKGERLFSTKVKECQDFLQYLFTRKSKKVEKLRHHSRFYRPDRKKEEEIIELLRFNNKRSSTEARKIIKKEARRLALHGRVRNYAVLLRALLTELNPYLPSAKGLVLTVDESFKEKIGRKQFDQIIISIFKNKIENPKPQIWFRDSRNSRCLQAVDIFCNLFYQYKNADCDVVPHEAISLKEDPIKAKIGEKWINIFRLLGAKIKVWLQPTSWAEVIQKSKS